MSYIGNSLTQQSFTGGVDQFNGNASNTAFGLTRTINTVYDVDVYVENVWQRPGVGYNVSANTITFTSAPSAGSNNVVVVYRNFTATSVVPVQGSVTTSSFAANAIPATLGYVPANKAGDTFTGPVTFANSSANVITMTTGGDIGIGNSNPLSRLHVTSAGANGIVLGIDSADSTASARIFGQANGSTGGMFWFHNSGNPMWCLTTGSTIGSSTGTTRLTVSQYGLALGNYDAATSGIGIKFPATQVASTDANTLDDYEEGTWTPTWGGWTTAGTTTYSTAQAGRYIKIGRFVMLKAWLGGSCSGGSTDYFSVGNFPFTTTSGNVEESGGIVSYITGVDMGASGRGWWFYPSSNSTKGLGGAITQTGITGANPNVSFNLYLTIVYMSAS